MTTPYIDEDTLKAIKSINDKKIYFSNQMQPIYEVMQSFATQMQSANNIRLESINEVAQSLASQMKSVNNIRLESINEMAQHFATQMQSVNYARLKSINEVMQNLANQMQLSSYLKTLDFSEIIQTIDEYSNSNIELSAQEEVVNSEELGTFIENEMLESQDNKVYLKDFLHKIAVTFGITVVIAIITTVLLPYLLTYSTNLLDSHQYIVDTFHETINSLVSTFGDYLVAKATIRDAIEEQNLSDYEHLNLIGVLRTDTYLRKGSSKNAPLATPQKIKVNTVVNLLEINQKLTTKRKQNWLKVHVKIADEYVEGWIEESKIQRFKKV